MPWMSASEEPLTQKRLHSLLNYDPETGVFTRRVSTAPRALAGSVAGDIDGKGYLRLRVDRKRYIAHRLAWFYVHGEWPELEIDHKNGVRTDNRIENLRLATTPQNRHNSKAHRDSASAKKGVSWHAQNKKWRARVYHDGREVLLGYFDRPEDAHSAYAAFVTSNRGDFARTG